MVFTVGYPHSQDLAQNFADLVSCYPQIVEVYFAVPGRPSGRPSLQVDHLQFLENIKAIKSTGRKLNMLLNSACDGADALTDGLGERIRRDITALSEHGCRPDSVTAVSFRTACLVKRAAPDMEVRISVINQIRSASAMSCYGNFADGFYVGQDLNRNMQALRRIKAWCADNGKKLYLLANSACMPECPFRTEHYNMVAHAVEIARSLKAEGSSIAWRIENTVPCQQIRAGNPLEFALRGTWIPPKNVHEYEGVCDMMKLSCRMHPDPKAIFDAYCLEKDCDLLDVLGERLTPTREARLPQSSLPDEAFKKFLTCHERGCDECGYCKTLAEKLGQKRP